MNATQISRRSFVASAAALGAVAALGTSVARAAEAAEETYDLVVVGAGSAGLTAAARAAQGGASVVVLEAAGATGGTTKLSGGHYKYLNDDFLSKMPARTEESDAELLPFLDYDPADFGDYADALTTLQGQIEEYLASDSTVEFDSVEYWLVLHFIYTQGTDLDGVEATTDYNVVAPAYYNSGEVQEWLVEGGMVFSDPQPGNRGAGGPLSVEPEGQGMGMITVLEDMCDKAGAQIVLNAKATEFVTDGGRVAGVVADVEGSPVTYRATKGVLLACGGFGSNPQMVSSYQNLFTGIDDTVPSCEAEMCDGTMLEQALNLGAASANMQFVQFFGFPVGQKFTIEMMIPLAMMSTKMSVNSDGVRFNNDTQRFYGGGSSAGTAPACNQPGGRFYLVGDASGKDVLADSWDGYVQTGVVCPGDTLEEAAEAAGLPAEQFAQTVTQFNEYVAAGEDPDFGRTNLEGAAVETAPFFVSPCQMHAQNTMGGVVIDELGRVLDEAGSPIEGLYAAGEVVGNLDGACRRHGDNYAHIFYYGWLCGKQIAEA
jgi:fumarate reductase flavoprotein subunit